MHLRPVALAVVLWLAAIPAAPAAETMIQAIDEIAGQFVASQRVVGRAAPAATGQAAAPQARRVAVTAFSHANRRPSLFSNFLMIALTGKMVELGGPDLRVIERAQLETALREIETGQVPIFDASTSQELGKAVGADTLIVGEITVLTDAVRIDARMIDVETIETIEQANALVPLTPTVQKQLDTPAALPGYGIGSDEASGRSGIWSGRGDCGDASFGITLSLVFNPDDTVTALQTFYPLNGGRGDTGVFVMEGSFDQASGEVSLDPMTWIVQPRGVEAAGMTGTINVERRTFEGALKVEGCGAVRLTRM